MSPPTASFSGAVLCGGASRRMGQDKALLQVHGVPMAQRVADALREAGAAEVFAVGGPVGALGALGLTVVPDEHPGHGPFPATLTALRHARHEVVVVLSCDLLHPSAEAIGALVAALRGAGPAVTGAVPVVDGHHQWTHAAWWRGALAPLGAARVAGARSFRRGAAHLALHQVTDLDARLIEDADTPEELGGASAGVAVRTGSLPPMDVPEIDATELAARHAAGAAVIDVREEHEFAEAHVPGARLIPLGEVASRIDEVPAGQTVYVICARGGRSAKATEHYRGLGIDAVNVAGGMLAWIDAGHPTEPVGRWAEDA